MNQERTYTLKEAKAELARQECLMNGHDYEVVATKRIGTAGEPQCVVCSCCGAHWDVKPAS